MRGRGRGGNNNINQNSSFGDPNRKKTKKNNNKNSRYPRDTQLITLALSFLPSEEHVPKLVCTRTILNSSIIPQFCCYFPNQMGFLQNDTMKKYIEKFLMRFSSTLQFVPEFYDFSLSSLPNARSASSNDAAPTLITMTQILKFLVEDTQYFACTARTFLFASSSLPTSNSRPEEDEEEQVVLSLLKKVRSMKRLTLQGFNREKSASHIQDFLESHPYCLGLESFTLQNSFKTLSSSILSLGRFKNLKTLNLYGVNDLTDFSFLKDLIRLTSLNLSYCRNFGQNNSDTQYLRDMIFIETLYLAETKVSDAGMENIKDMKFLRELQLTECTNLTDCFVTNVLLADGVFDGGYFEHLNVYYCSKLTRDVLEKAYDKFVKLNEDFELLDRPSASSARWAMIYRS